MKYLPYMYISFHSILKEFSSVRREYFTNSLKNICTPNKFNIKKVMYRHSAAAIKNSITFNDVREFASIGTDIELSKLSANFENTRCLINTGNQKYCCMQMSWKGFKCFCDGILHLGPQSLQGFQWKYLAYIGSTGVTVIMMTVYQLCWHSYNGLAQKSSKNDCIPWHYWSGRSGFVRTSFEQVVTHAILLHVHCSLQRRTS